MNINTKVGNVSISINTSRLDNNLKEAQMLLNMQVVADCTPLVPFSQGALRNSVNYPEGIYGGSIEWNTPYAHYLYEGIVYSPNIPIKDKAGNIVGWFSPPSKKPTGRSLTYGEPGTTDHWFEEAKKAHGAEWIRLVQETVGK